MKKIVILLAIAGLLAFITSCSSDDSTQPATTTTTTTVQTTTTVAVTTGTISGTISLPAGAAGDVTNTRVATYASFDDWAADRVLKFTACANTGAYTIPDLPPGTYYMDAWKDMNGNSIIDLGDFFNVYGSGSYPNYQLSPVSVAAGQTVSVNFQVVIL